MAVSSQPRRAVYTALIGGYEMLNEQPVAARSDLPFICFTDAPSLRSDTWQIELVEPAMPSDPIRSARKLKIVGHPLLDDVDETLWVDNSVMLRVRPEEILDEWLTEADFAAPLHSYRDRLIDEFDAVVAAGFDDPTRVYEQVRHYLAERPDVLDAKPLFTALLARRRTPEVADMCRQWFTDVLRYSRRDQLSVLPAIDRSSLTRWQALELDTFTSRYHEWPVTARRDRSGPARNPLESMKPLALRVRALEQAADEMASELRNRSALLAASDEQRRGLLAAIAHREEMIGTLGSELDALRASRDDSARRLDEMERSRSWRIGRAVTRALRPSQWLRARPR